MQRVLAVAGVVLFGMAGVAHADSPGGWSQFNDMVAKAQGRVTTPTQPVQVEQARPVYDFATQNRRGTVLFPPNPNEGANN
jgi:hypothetical protein